MTSNVEMSAGSAHVFLSATDLSEIDERFESVLLEAECLVFWTGVKRPMVQQWADKQGLKTLTSAMGPLMDPQNPNSARRRIRESQWSKYMKGASSRFAEYACRSRRAVVVTNPPPNIYSTRKNSTYRHVEEPILKGTAGSKGVISISYVHPTVDGAADFQYQVWPIDKSSEWARFLEKACEKIMTINAVLGSRSLARLTQIKDDMQVRAHTQNAGERQQRAQDKKEAKRKKVEDVQQKAHEKKEAKRKKVEDEQRKALEKKDAKRRKAEDEQRKAQEKKQAERKIHEERQQNKVEEDQRKAETKKEVHHKRVIKEQRKVWEKKEAKRKKVEDVQREAQEKRGATRKRVENEQRKILEEKQQNKVEEDQRKAQTKKEVHDKRTIKEQRIAQEKREAMRKRIEEEQRKVWEKKEAKRKRIEEEQQKTRKKKEAERRRAVEMKRDMQGS